jgi:hypothetical protein
MNGKSDPIFRDRNSEPDLDWYAKLGPGRTRSKLGPAGAGTRAKLTFCDHPAMPITPGTKFGQAD